MSTNTHDFTINQGETFSKLITWRDAANALINLTGFTARMQLRRKKWSTDILFELTTENSRIVLGGAAGTISLSVAAIDTSALNAVYIYDLELINGSYVKRLLQGTITVDPEITR